MSSSGRCIMRASTTANTADLLDIAVNDTIGEFGLNVKTYMNFYYLWSDKQKGVAQNNGFDYLQEGVFVFIDDTEIVIRQVVNNAINAGEVKLTGFATRNLELIQGAIESALVF